MKKGKDPRMSRWAPNQISSVTHSITVGVDLNLRGWPWGHGRWGSWGGWSGVMWRTRIERGRQFWPPKPNIKCVALDNGGWWFKLAGVTLGTWEVGWLRWCNAENLRSRGESDFDPKLNIKCITLNNGGGWFKLVGVAPRTWEVGWLRWCDAENSRSRGENDFNPKPNIECVALNNGGGWFKLAGMVLETWEMRWLRWLRWCDMENVRSRGGGNLDPQTKYWVCRTQ